jgi:hypothetical protein
MCWGNGPSHVQISLMCWGNIVPTKDLGVNWHPFFICIKDPNGQKEGTHLSTPLLLSLVLCLHTSYYHPSYLPFSLFFIRRSKIPNNMLNKVTSVEHGRDKCLAGSVFRALGHISDKIRSGFIVVLASLHNMLFSRKT